MMPAIDQCASRTRTTYAAALRRYIVLAVLATLPSVVCGAEGGGHGIGQSGGAVSGEYVAMDPPMIANIFSRDSVHFVKATVQLKLKDPSMAGTVTTHLPALRDALLMLLSDRPYFELTTIAGKTKLRDEATETLRKFMLENTGDPVIESVLFTSLVLQ